MHEGPTTFSHLEWPAPGERVCGPVVWLRGWVVGKPGFEFTDVRVRAATGTHLGVLGLPRRDLATHFKNTRPWLPAEFVVGVPLPSGPATLQVEAMDEHGNWHALPALDVTVAADGARSPRVEGEVVSRPGGSATVRVPHLPFHGHLDDPVDETAVHHGRVAIFGWLLHETQAVNAVFATTDGLVFNTLESGLTDDSLATKVPQHPAARCARLKGAVDVPLTRTNPVCLRVYAQLADGSVHLCFARRLQPAPEILAPLAPALREPRATSLPPFASGRPRRLLLVVHTLQPDDATLRALDVARFLAGHGRWVPRLVAAEDGPLHGDFEACGCPVQIVSPRDYFAAIGPAAAESALAALGREIWWHHLDAVAVFDPASTWAEKLARPRGIAVFDDPADAVAWFSPSLDLTSDPGVGFVAPIRGQARHGAGVLLHAANLLARHQPKLLAGRGIIVSDVRHSSEEELFRADVALASPAVLAISASTPLMAAMVCPAFAGHPHRHLLAALAAGVPVVTTPSPVFTAALGPNEITTVAPGNPLALAHALADVLANPAAARRRAEAARRIVLSLHAPDRQLPRWLGLLAATVRR